MIYYIFNELVLNITEYYLPKISNIFCYMKILILKLKKGYEYIFHNLW